MEGRMPFEGHETWYRVEGDLHADGPTPLVTLHGGPGMTHDYLLSLTDLAHGRRPVVFYDQLGSGNSTHLPQRGADFWTVELFARQLAALLEHLGIAGRYHLLGQSWGGFLAQEHAFTQPQGLRSLVLSNTAASFLDVVTEANRLRADLPPEVEATLRRHEVDGTTGDPEYARACQVFYKRHLCRVDPWPKEVVRSFELLEQDPTVYHVMNGPSEFHVTGSICGWQSKDRLNLIGVPTLVISGRHDEATPALQQALVDTIPQTEQVILEHSSHMPFWEEREAYMAAVDDWLTRHD
ncbi:proline iminopeptidase-family hydrolase [Streptomyces wuyuanensis]|uniref:proline iminopeptidase-family hydrolase n=1 Tax=Streptomyces wuyuanensis TaxID=1196353 RepID=UPI00341374DC